MSEGAQEPLRALCIPSQSKDKEEGSKVLNGTHAPLDSEPTG